EKLARIAETQAREAEQRTKGELDQEKVNQQTAQQERSTRQINAALVELADLEGKLKAAGPAEIRKWADALGEAHKRAQALLDDRRAAPVGLGKWGARLETAKQVERDRRRVARVEELRIRKTLFRADNDAPVRKRPPADGPDEESYASIF